MLLNSLTCVEVGEEDIHHDWRFLFNLISALRVHRHATEDNLGSSSARHKIVVMGATKVGKSSLITQFLYSRYLPKYKRTIEEMHQGNFNVAGVGLTLDILDTSGSNEVIFLLLLIFVPFAQKQNLWATRRSFHPDFILLVNIRVLWFAKNHGDVIKAGDQYIHTFILQKNIESMI